MNEAHRLRITKAIETVRDVLERAGMSPKAMEDADGFTVDLKDDGPPVQGFAHLLSEEKFVFFFTFMETTAPGNTERTVEFITRANYGLTIGNFEFDYETGSVRYKASIDFSGTELHAILVRNTVLSSMYSVETYATALVQVMHGTKSPKDAVAESESSLDVG